MLKLNYSLKLHNAKLELLLYFGTKFFKLK